MNHHKIQHDKCNVLHCAALNIGVWPSRQQPHRKGIWGSWWTISWKSQWCIIVEMETANVQDCICRVASRLREVVVIPFTPLFRGHFSSTVSSSGFPRAEEPLGSWSVSSSNHWCGWGLEILELRQKPEIPGSGQPGEGNFIVILDFHVWLGRTQRQMLPVCTAKKERQAMARMILTLCERKMKVLLLRMVLY